MAGEQPISAMSCVSLLLAGLLRSCFGLFRTRKCGLSADIVNDKQQKGEKQQDTNDKYLL
ncbi:MAG TPA: hypothetical protein VG737_16090 [Cyclobacteriaceae bacterium]|nr:hypothetical protein [Cyclobacteriaceae bacterium]